MSDFKLIVDLHKPNARLGPGSEEHTLRALELSGLREKKNLEIADLGCGTGSATLVLADSLDAQIAAVDLFPEFLEELSRRAQEARVLDRITTVQASFDDLSFEPESFDAIWSEGAIYNLGFEAGIRAWSPLLKSGGVLAVSELTWLTHERPAELDSHWNAHYPEVDTAAAKIAILERHGFTPIGYFPLPESCWMDDFYDRLRERFPAFLEEHGHSDDARAMVDSEEAEIRLYERYREYVSYGFYIARSRGDCRAWYPPTHPSGAVAPDSNASRPGGGITEGTLH